MGVFISLEKHSLRCLLLELLIDRTKISVKKFKGMSYVCKLSV